MVLSVQLNTCPGRGVGMGSGFIQFSQVFFSSLKGPFITLVISSRLYTHTADSSPLSLHIINTTGQTHETIVMEKQKAEEEIQFKRDESSTGGQIRSEMKQNKYHCEVNMP